MKERLEDDTCVGSLAQASTGLGSSALFATPASLLDQGIQDHEVRMALKLRATTTTTKRQPFDQVRDSWSVQCDMLVSPGVWSWFQ